MNLRKERLSWVLVLFLLMVVGVTGYYVVLPQLQPHATMRLGDGVFTAQVVAKGAVSAVNKSTVEQLRPNQAILYMYDNPALWAVDMKDRQAVLDIVWLDTNKKVVYIVKNASAESTKGTVFRPKTKAKYIVEYVAGTVEKKAINIDSAAVFDENNIQGVNL